MGRPGTKKDRLASQMATLAINRFESMADAGLSGDDIDRAYVAQAPIEHRKRFAQFFTPQESADLMAQWVLGNSSKEILDPAVGTGVLARAVLRQNPEARVIGYDIDPVIANVARGALSSLSKDSKIINADFLREDPRITYEAIIANPPYLRHHDLEDASQKITEISERLGIRLSRLTNAYGLFLLDCCRRLKPGGRLAFIIPTEWTNANFGDAIKLYLLKNNLLKYLIYTCNSKTVFKDALTTACILLVENGGDNSGKVVSVFVPDGVRFPTLNQITANRKSDLAGVFFQELIKADLIDAPKWDSIIKRGVVAVPPGFVALRTLASTKRGVATGANSFFHISIESARRWGLTDKSLRPCVGRANDTVGVRFTADDFANLIRLGRRTHLICLTSGLTEAERDYIRKGEAASIHLRYLTKQRNPWHSTENMSVAPIWAAVFGRKRIRFIANEANVFNLTTFHGVFPIRTDIAFVRALTACLNSTIVQNLMKAQIRVYGGGLNKVEPRDLLDIAVPDLRKISKKTLTSLAELFLSVHLPKSDEESQLDLLDRAVTLAAKEAAAAKGDTVIHQPRPTRKSRDQLSLSLP